MTDPNCFLCHGTKQVDMLNIWLIQRRCAVNGYDLNEAMGGSVDNLPFIKMDNGCPYCCTEEECTDAFRALEKKMGGNPFESETFNEAGQA